MEFRLEEEVAISPYSRLNALFKPASKPSMLIRPYCHTAAPWRLPPSIEDRGHTTNAYVYTHTAAVFSAPIRADIVQALYKDVSKNKRQPC